VLTFTPHTPHGTKERSGNSCNPCGIPSGHGYYNYSFHVTSCGWVAIKSNNVVTLPSQLISVLPVRYTFC